MAFSDIENSEKLDIINIAIIDNEDFKNNEIFKEAFKELSDENNEDRLFYTKYVSEDEAKGMLENSEITGYIIFNDEDVDITVSSSGINETILRYIVEEISTNKEMVENLVAKEIENELKKGNININYEEIYSEVSNLLEDNTVKLNNISNKNLSYTMIEYYTLIAMSCLYGGVISMFITNYKLANMNAVGKRTAVSGVHKGKMLLGSLLASYIVQIIGVAILFVYTIFVLKVDYGDNLPMVILLALVGSLAGLSIGVAVSTLVKANENAKTGILIAVTMFGCFLSGMMGITLKYVIDKNIPILNKINPASMITDGFYSLYYYDTLDRFYFNIISLLIFSALMIAISIRGLRRQKFKTL